MIRADYEPENQSLNSGTQYSVAQVSVYFYDDATVFGIAGTEETIVRYDLPARGITEGWTVSAVVDQTEAMAEENWPDICVAIFADDADVYDDFARVLTQHGARVFTGDLDESSEGAASTDAEYDTESADPDTGPLAAVSTSQGGAHAAAERRGDDAFAAARAGVNQRAAEKQSVGSNFVQLVARKPKRHRHAKAGWRPRPFQILVAAGIAVTSLSGWWVVDRYSGADEDGGVGDGGAVITADAAGDRSDGDAFGGDATAEIPQMVHEHSGLRLVTPRGFVIGDSSQPGVFAATGEDPNLRIYVTTDQLHDDAAAQIDHDAVLTDIMQTVKSSPDLQEGRREHEPREQVRYVENPGDGSRIAWTSWVEGNHQLTVGCHSRHTTTEKQKQACELVVGSLE
ncbi:type VII secretion-associated protein [Corynebacterium propinquum]|uniref:type VII secretion-associated protein n=2 Tax=Corynebacteriaceae TaxID=1653 RepID=UPI001EF21B37|nr:type VII secretion-associated protein [Corynebacterium propinquum]MCG7232683.1 type VII secretion-associated protein [Corynebacterium propinquum]MDK4302571.1 type VII secretion-associated protein [Corynebacterium propinquum]MDK8536321.1 type VII secretion-associated protein [Corynebacterium propinquum]MDK8666371.1 type VII secretion-associated protein [Corynebacterium propinquum]WKS44453.1 type VII secretion-associated protein [Corynebacterium propinquum]